MKGTNFSYDRGLDYFNPKTPEQQFEDKMLNELLDRFSINVDKTVSIQPFVIEVNGTVMATESNFSVSAGKQRSKKGLNALAIVAAALSSKQVLNYTVKLPKSRNKVLYVDTKQTRCKCEKELKQILTMAGKPTDIDSDQLIYISLRESWPKQRREIIGRALETNPKIGLVVINSCQDLLSDINDPVESYEVITDLIQWVSIYNIHIHITLSANKANDNISGHLGTELMYKSETVLQITESPIDSDISEVRPIYVRNLEFAPFAFRTNEDGIPMLEPEYKF